MNIEKEKNIEFIKGFSSIRLLDILKKNKIDSSNFYKGKISSEKVKLIKDDIDRYIIHLYYDRMNYNEEEN